jgi:hypothetical protein
MIPSPDLYAHSTYLRRKMSCCGLTVTVPITQKGEKHARAHLMRMLDAHECPVDPIYEPQNPKKARK